MAHPRRQQLRLNTVEDEAGIECANLVRTLVEQFGNEIDALLSGEDDPLRSYEFRKSYTAKFKAKIATFDTDCAQYPVETRERNKRILMKSMHLQFQKKATWKEATPKVQTGLNDPSSYFWDKIRADRDDVNMIVDDYLTLIVSPTLVSHPGLIEEVRDSSKSYVNEVFRELVTSFSNNLSTILRVKFDSQFDMVTWFDIFTFGLFPNIKDKYTKSCECLNALIDNISICQLDPGPPVVLFDQTTVNDMKQALIAHANQRKIKALDKRTEKRIVAFNVGFATLIVAGAIAVAYLAATSGVTFHGLESQLLTNVREYSSNITEWFFQKKETINNIVKLLITGSIASLLNLGAPRCLQHL